MIVLLIRYYIFKCICKFDMSCQASKKWRQPKMAKHKIIELQK